jgi:hypothetical protein
MCLDQTAIHQPLNYPKHVRGKLSVLGFCLSPVDAVESYLVPEHGEDHGKGWFDRGACCRDDFTIRLERDVFSPSPPNRAIAELGSIGLRDTVESILQAIASISTNVRRASRAVVIEDFFGSEFEGKMKVCR